MQIFLGVGSFVIFFILLSFYLDTRHSLTCEELYCGFAFICIGCFGLYAVRNISLATITSFLILNIFGNFTLYIKKAAKL